MNLRDAEAHVARDQPELKGTARMEAIKALRDQPDPETARPSPAAAGGDAFCRNCDQPVKPTVRNGWGKLATLIAVAELVAVVVSVVAVFRHTHFGGGVIARLVLWPALIHPSGVGVVAAVAAFVAAVGVAGSLTQRAERSGSCPKCKSTLAAQPQG